MKGFQKGNTYWKYNVGKKRSEETKRKLSIVAKGQRRSPKTEFKKGINQKGENNGYWKGGIIKSSGYIKIWFPSHPYCDTKGYVFEHRLVMEKHLGRHLLPGEEIHHIDGNRENNIIENLIHFESKSSHQKYEWRIRKNG